MKFTEKMLRLYAITDRTGQSTEAFLRDVEAALEGGATLLQLREKETDDREFLALAKQVRRLCARYDVPLIINDNIDVCLKSGADGVHVGQEDADPATVRKRIGPDRVLGVTAKTTEQAMDAESAGADYLGSGAVFGSVTKPGALSLSPRDLAAITRAVSIPVVAIGGINRHTTPGLSGAGIHGIAVVSGLFGAADVKSEAQVLRALAEDLVRETIHRRYHEK